jgi:hypothetical protein
VTARASLSVDQLEIEIEVEKPRRRRRHLPDTSLAHATQSSTATELLRAQILGAITAAAIDPSRRGATSDEVHGMIAGDEVELNDVRRLMEVRRRVSDLHTGLKKIRDTKLRRPNSTGNPMIVWAPVID